MNYRTVRSEIDLTETKRKYWYFSPCIFCPTCCSILCPTQVVTEPVLLGLDIFAEFLELGLDFVLLRCLFTAQSLPESEQFTDKAIGRGTYRNLLPYLIYNYHGQIIGSVMGPELLYTFRSRSRRYGTRPVVVTIDIDYIHRYFLRKAYKTF